MDLDAQIEQGAWGDAWGVAQRGAQDEPPGSLVAAGRVARLVGRWDDARDWLLPAGKSEDVRVRLQAWHELHLALVAQHRWNSAGRVRALILEHGIDALGTDHPFVLTAHVSSAMESASRGETERAVRFARIVDDRAHTLDPRDPLRLLWRGAIAAVHAQRSDHESAAALYSHVLGEAEEAWGPDHPYLIDLLNERMRARYELGHPEAEADRQSIVAIAAHLGPARWGLVHFLINAGLLLRAQGRAAEATQSLEEAVALAEEATPQGVAVAEARLALATDCLTRNDHQRAAALTAPTLEEMGARLPTRTHIELHRMQAVSALQAGDKQACLESLTEAARIAEEGGRDEWLVDVLGELGVIHFMMDDRDRSFSLLQRRLQILEKRVGVDAPATIKTRNALLHILAGAPDPDVVAHSLEPDADGEPDEPRRRGLGGIGSAVLFLAAFTWLAGWLDAILLLSIVFVHELGHWAAMKALGYQDPKIFFVPFFGAVTTGSAAPGEQTAARRAIVALAGPMPSLALAMVLAFVAPVFPMAPSEAELTLLQRIFLYTVGLNYLNLLPITPLDGGRVVDALVLARWPWARAAFAVGSGGLLLALGLLSGEMVMIGFGGILFGAALFAMRRVNLEAAIARGLGAIDRDERTSPSVQVGVLHEVMAPLSRQRQLPYLGRLRTSSRALADALLQPGTPSSRWALLSAYGATLMMTIPLLGLASWLAGR